MSPPQDFPRFIDESIRCSNVHRSRHQAPPLTHNPDLTAMAQKWAEDLARKSKMQHSDKKYRVHKGQPVGENIATYWSSDGRDYPGPRAVDSWYNEIKDYDFSSHNGTSPTKVVGHFTQLVWKGSLEVGFGKAWSRDGKTCMIVANYFPSGNYVGRNAENVFPPGPVNENIILVPIPSSSSVPKEPSNEIQQLPKTVTLETMAPPLTHNPDLTAMAQKWAEDIARRGVMEHSSDTYCRYKGQPAGENIAMYWSTNGSDYTGSQAVDRWYREIKDYDFRSHTATSPEKVVGHFTQLVWKGSHEVGFGKAWSRDGKTCKIVANYFPAGNYEGQEPENVSPPTIEKPYAVQGSEISDVPKTATTQTNQGPSWKTNTVAPAPENIISGRAGVETSRAGSAGALTPRSQTTGAPLPGSPSAGAQMPGSQSAGAPTLGSHSAGAPMPGSQIAAGSGSAELGSADAQASNNKATSTCIIS